MTPVRLSVIVPAYNAAATLPQTLAALTRSQPCPYEIIVVDDGSTDSTAALAQAYGVQVVRLAENGGAAAAKNAGARATSGDVLFFTDSDIVVGTDVVARLAADFADVDCDGIVGLLDKTIPARDFASQFKNLWMNFTYARLAPLPRIGLFYTSAAAMRRDAFFKAGEFDENYRGASLAEDTEFGQRAWERGVRIRLDAELRVVHLKQYSTADVLREDLRRARALTLMRLRKWGQPFFTSVPLFYQLAVPVLYVTLAFYVLGLVLQNTFWIALGVGGLAVFYALNGSLLGFLARRRGIQFATAGALFLPLDVFVVGIGMMAALFDFARGQRY